MYTYFHFVNCFGIAFIVLFCFFLLWLSSLVTEWLSSILCLNSVLFLCVYLLQIFGLRLPWGLHITYIHVCMYVCYMYICISLIQDGEVEGHALIFSWKNTKTTISCWTIIDRIILEPTKKTPYIQGQSRSCTKAVGGMESR